MFIKDFGTKKKETAEKIEKMLTIQSLEALSIHQRIRMSYRKN